MSIQSYRELVVWQKAMDLVIMVYRLTALFPTEERYGLTSQMRRSAVSISSNIAEGSRRGTRKDFRQFLLMSFGSGAELETQLEIVKRLHLDKSSLLIQETEQLLTEVMKMLNTMQHRLQQ